MQSKWSSPLKIILIALISAFLLLGFMNGIHIVRAYIIVQNAARQATRYAASGQPLIEGQPWQLPNEPIPGPDNDRVDFIVARALELTGGLKVDVYAAGSFNERSRHPQTRLRSASGDASLLGSR